MWLHRALASSWRLILALLIEHMQTGGFFSCQSFNYSVNYQIIEKLASNQSNTKSCLCVGLMK